MSLYFAEGSPTTILDSAALKVAIDGVLDSLGDKPRVMALPPDFTRFNSRAGELTCMVHDYYGDALVDVMPALGTHFPMEKWQLDKMFPGLPQDLIREHDWRNDVVTVGEVPSEVVSEYTEGLWDRPWKAQLNKMIWEGKHDLVVSIGQVVPHEVIGMANYNKNVFVGTGGVEGINESHFIGAAYGMERMMGRANTPLRKILNYAEREFISEIPVLYILTVIGATEEGELVVRGLYIGDDPECFERACELSLKVNFNLLKEEPTKMVVYLDEEEFHSTWLGNKGIYRTRMAVADDGDVIILAPGAKTFGEDPDIDMLIRKYGYRTTPEVMKFVDENEDLRNNLSAAAHLIHGSPEDRFKVTYCPGELTREEIEGVGFQYADLDEMMAKYPPDQLKEGWNDWNGERIYFIGNPALGLWAHEGRFDS